MSEPILTIEGEVDRPGALSLDDLSGIDAAHQVPDMSRLDPKRQGRAVAFAGLLQLVGPRPDARWVTLHASADDFHASVPLESIRGRGLLIYAADDGPLPLSAGGPVRFFIPDVAACHSQEVDECANVKFVDRLEFTRERGFDNRPADDAEHEELHRRQEDAG